ncbi:aquaporin-like [Calliopsis andreniformis]|uniref:aquaporin-like n=1 Tax=Calliopsis andreniformis TaxID=337506 RepID=UPI003FCDCD86
MEQGGISIITPTGINDNSVGKSKSIGITLRSNSSIQAAKEKLKSPWLTALVKEDASGWETLLVGVAEIVGTALLVFIGCTGCIGSFGTVPSTLQISFTFGFAVMIAIQSIGHISGAHINPSLTVAAVILGKKSLPMAILYICCQCIGALLGYGLIKTITPPELMYHELNAASSFCVSDVNSSLTPTQGFTAEAIATGILTLFACGIWDYRNAKNTDSMSLRFGLCITALCFIFIPYTGCSLNPARTLGPAVWNGYWTNHWIYWLGPFTGAIVASLLYRCIFLCDKYLGNRSPGGMET